MLDALLSRYDDSNTPSSHACVSGVYVTGRGVLEMVGLASARVGLGRFRVGLVWVRGGAGGVCACVVRSPARRSVVHKVGITVSYRIRWV